MRLCATDSYEMNWQVIESPNFLGTTWATEFAEIPSSEMVNTSRASTVRFLELLRTKVTAARPLGTPVSPNGLPVILDKDLMAAHALEIYLHYHEDAQPWEVAPPEWFFNTSRPTLPPAAAGG